VTRTKRADLGDRIRAARTERGWKQKHLASKVEVEPITVSRWERGATTPDLDVLGLVADATGKPLSYFVGDDSEGGGSTSLDEAVSRLEAAAASVAKQSEQIAGTLAEVRDELRSLRGSV
jgi:transcriptional regulator with XRE-family HTH domain